MNNGREVMTMTYDMADFLKSCVAAYVKLASEQGFDRPLSLVKTPFLAEDPHAAIQSKPCLSSWQGIYLHVVRGFFSYWEPALDATKTKVPKKQVAVNVNGG